MKNKISELKQKRKRNLVYRRALELFERKHSSYMCYCLMFAHDSLCEYTFNPILCYPEFIAQKPYVLYDGSQTVWFHPSFYYTRLGVLERCVEQTELTFLENLLIFLF